MIFFWPKNHNYFPQLTPLEPDVLASHGRKFTSKSDNKKIGVDDQGLTNYKKKKIKKFLVKHSWMVRGKHVHGFKKLLQ